MKLALLLLATCCAGIQTASINFDGLFKNLPALRGDWTVNIYDINSQVRSNGYYLTKHQVITEDGYTLDLHQISDSNVEGGSEDKPPVLVMHDLMGTSAEFAMLDRGKSLAYQLVDAGYDVWLGNNRGNTYCQTHETMNVTNSSFWDFSFHELGVYDAPIIVDHILRESNSDTLSLIGYGQGAAQFLVMIASDPTYNNKINDFVALAPLAYISHSTHPLAMLLKGHDDIVEGLGAHFNVSDVLDHYDGVDSLSQQFCKTNASLCEALLFIVEGFDVLQLDKADLLKIFLVLPGDMSVKQLVHYLQLLKSGSFSQFDYGIINNMELYGQINPPNYNIAKVTVPVDIFYSQNDLWLSVKDAEKLAGELPNSTLHMVSYDYFSHLDYIVGKDASSLLYFDLINVLNEKNGLKAITSTTTTTTTRGPPNTEDTEEPADPTGVTTIEPPTTTDGAENIVQISVVLTLAGLAGSLLL